MKLETLSTDSWSSVPLSSGVMAGYLGTFITRNDEPRHDLLVFRDENDKKHFVIEVSNANNSTLKDPQINGLKLAVKDFSFNGKEIKSYVDLACEQEYLEEFTQLIKEIATKILIEDHDHLDSITEVIQNWKAFWASRIRNILSEDEQMGLLCELLVLNSLCAVNPIQALSSWRGPNREKHDFVFSQWAFEVKATRRGAHIHVINGIDQLKKPLDKELGFISFLMAQTESPKGTSLHSAIQSLVEGPLKKRPFLVENLYSLLSQCGYSRLHFEDYKTTKFEVVDAAFHNVDNAFPKLTTEQLECALSNRVSEIRYKIDLEGLMGIDLKDLKWGNYFY